MLFFVLCCSLLCSNVFKTKQFPGNDFILSTSFNISAKFSGSTGLLKAVSVGSSEVMIDLDFVTYGTRSGKERSGAYLFMPDKEASSILSSRSKPSIIIIAGPLVSIVMYIQYHGRRRRGEDLQYGVK